MYGFIRVHMNYVSTLKKNVYTFKTILFGSKVYIGVFTKVPLKICIHGYFK